MTFFSSQVEALKAKVFCFFKGMFTHTKKRLQIQIRGRGVTMSVQISAFVSKFCTHGDTLQ